MSLFISCGTGKFLYDYPPNLDAKDKLEYENFIKRGRQLYLVNCSSCHGKNYSSMDGQNQFTETQIRNYAVNLKIRNETHKFTQRMNKDDIDAICVYLRYRK
ncbi:MAG: hypothetical protein HOP11_01655 [Saprospiraceae bacterium]|nr:hypothetical protein [Saprospiraceae bacterium]